MDYNSIFCYVPYAGGAGPTEQQTELLNLKLLTALQGHGLKPVLRESEDCMDVLEVALGDKAVGYDRWGYCSADGVLDQVDLNAAMAYMLGG